LLDGTDLRQIDPGDLRRNVGAVLQDVWLFSGTVRDNIAIGAVRPRDPEVLEAARVAGVDAFVARHPAGYDMPLAERGEGDEATLRAMLSDRTTWLLHWASVVLSVAVLVLMVWQPGA
jgi:ABC-type protease/lipase transport system fused ATPase/permease subunit